MLGRSRSVGETLRVCLGRRHGIYLQARLEDEKQCILVLIGATPEGHKELVGFTDGARESAQDRRELLLDLKRRGLDVRPELTIADGALGFWKTASEIWPTTREQRCWVHKTSNVLAKLPKSQQPKAKRALQEIWMAETKADAEIAFDAFIESYQVKYDKAAECLTKDRDALLTTNPIDVCNRAPLHDPVEGLPVKPHRARHGLQAYRSRAENLASLDGNNQLPKLILGVKFADGLEVAAKPANREPATVAA
jgi:mutator family transposase